MKIKDIPFPKLKELALKQQELQGNERDEELDLRNTIIGGNFDWDKTEQEYLFWKYVYAGRYEKASGIFDWDAAPKETTVTQPVANQEQLNKEMFTIITEIYEKGLTPKLYKEIGEIVTKLNY